MSAHGRAMKINRPLEQVSFGASISFGDTKSTAVVEQLEHEPSFLPDLLIEAGGLVVLRGLHEVRKDPSLLVRISRALGPEVENYYQTLTAERFFHTHVPEVLVLSNRAPCSHQPPPQPQPPLTAAGGLPIQFPHRKGWHTDQSYRRPPPDVSLLYAVETPPSNQGQTLFADCTSAYETLDEVTKQRIQSLVGIHAPKWIGRSEYAVRNGETPRPLLAHQHPQRQPLVRFHPVTGNPALYLCEDGQMDFVDGPIEGMETGPDGEGAKLLYALVTHTTRSEFVYVHKWQPGDLVIGDNRCLLHTATWYDATKFTRLMWRTTVMGNPGKEYSGESKSWLSSEGHSPMQGMEDV